MPNWVYNTLHVHAPNKEAMDKFISKMSKPIPHVATDYTIAPSQRNTTVEVISLQETDFSFWNILRPKKKLWKEYWSVSDNNRPENNWYNWNVANWGCKWDVHDESSVERSDDTYASVTFDTPWSPPMGIIHAIGDKFPDLSFTWAWQEEQGFGGEFEIDSDGVTETDSYDIPSSHSEMMNRQGYCHCEHYDLDEDLPFDDCHRDGGEPLIQIAPLPANTKPTEQENK